MCPNATQHWGLQSLVLWKGGDVLPSSPECDGPCQALPDLRAEGVFLATSLLMSQPLREALKSQPQIKTYEHLETMKNFPNKRGGTLRYVLSKWSDFREGTQLGKV